MFINKRIHDVIGVGIGPFNLGMAAITQAIPSLDCLFFDQRAEFQWHEGMMLPHARLQVPFYADLVTVVDPCSRWTFLNYLKQNQRLFRFAIHENNFITRKEYNDYCRWVAEGLDSLRFQHQVVDVHYETGEQLYQVMVHNLQSNTVEFYYGRHLVIGIGSVPYIPEELKGVQDPLLVHSADYMTNKQRLLESGNVTIIGSGQSAAEIFHDLLSYVDGLDSLHWFTRSQRFFPMEYSKLSLELTSLDYIDHFYGLTEERKQSVLKKQDVLYKGINFSLINDIYDALYLHDLHGHTCKVCLHPNTALRGAAHVANKMELSFYHLELEQAFTHQTRSVVLATGYRPTPPAFLESISDNLYYTHTGQLAVQRNYAIGKNVFVQNAELHTHGFNAPDLGMGPYRNATILNSILGYEHFLMERHVSFQKFGL